METIIGEQKAKADNAPNWAAAIIAGLIGIVAAAIWLQSEFGIRPTRSEVKETMIETMNPTNRRLDEQSEALKEIDQKLDEMREWKE